MKMDSSQGLFFSSSPYHTIPLVGSKIEQNFLGVGGGYRDASKGNRIL